MSSPRACATVTIFMAALALSACVAYPSYPGSYGYGPTAAYAAPYYATPYYAPTPAVVVGGGWGGGWGHGGWGGDRGGWHDGGGGHGYH